MKDKNGWEHFEFSMENNSPLEVHLASARGVEIFKIDDKVMSTWLIWSIEHNAWWALAERGYVVKKSKACRYTYKEAAKIVREANKFTGNMPNEAVIPLFD